MRTDFDDWYDEQCRIDAAELVGPNSHEYDQVAERFEGDETRREAAMHRWALETGNRAS